MKKTIALLLAVMLVVSMAPAAFASSTTTLTTTVPGATYEFSIPADTEIPYNSLDTRLGYVHVTKSSGFAYGKNLEITIEYAPLSNADGSSTIPYKIGYVTTSDVNETAEKEAHGIGYKSTGSSFTFKGQNDGTVKRLATYDSNSATALYYGELGVLIDSSAWGKALAGEHTSIITFTAAVVQD